MRLSAKAIVNFANINNYSFGNQWIIRAGEPNTLYFQLVDLDQASLRYMAGIGGSNQPFGVTVKFPSIDSANVLSIAAVQADASDSSIWKVVLSSSQIPGGGNVQFEIQEGSAIRRCSVLNLLAVEFPQSVGGC